MTLTNLIQQVLIKLGEDADSLLAAFLSGVGENGVTVTSDLVITGLLNNAKDRACCAALLFESTATQAVTIGGGPKFPLSAFTGSGIKKMRRALVVTWTATATSPVVLKYVSPASLRIQHPNKDIDGNGPTLEWSQSIGSPPVIEIYQKPTTTGTLTAIGYAIAPDLATGSDDTSTWLPEEYVQVLVVYACAEICRQRIDDDNLVERSQSFAMQHDRLMAQMRGVYPEWMSGKFLDDLLPLVPQKPAPKH